jgi:hypothetical protein
VSASLRGAFESVRGELAYGGQPSAFWLVGKEALHAAHPSSRMSLFIFAVNLCLGLTLAASVDTRAGRLIDGLSPQAKRTVD